MGATLGRFAVLQQPVLSNLGWQKRLSEVTWSPFAGADGKSKTAGADSVHCVLLFTSSFAECVMRRRVARKHITVLPGSACQKNPVASSFSSRVCSRAHIADRQVRSDCYNAAQKPVTFAQQCRFLEQYNVSLKASIVAAT